MQGTSSPTTDGISPLDRGLHIYQNIGRNFYLMGYYDLDLRPCLETKIVYTKVE